MNELLHPVLFVLILAATGIAAHVGLRRACRRFDEARGGRNEVEE